MFGHSRPNLSSTCMGDRKRHETTHCHDMGKIATGMARTSANPARKDPLRVGFSPGPGKTCCRNKRQQEEPPVGLEAGSQLKSQGKWLGVGGTFLWDFTYLCWNLTYGVVSAFARFSMTVAISVQTWSRSPVAFENVMMALLSLGKA